MDSGLKLHGTLPDEVLHHVLSFLPAQEAVRTCLLARRWLHLWKSATGLRIGEDDIYLRCVKDNKEFLDRLLLLRDGAPLDTCVLRFRWLDWYRDEGLDDTVRVNHWFRHALLHKFIFKRDLEWCPTFTKLKTLLLNEYWCVPDDFSALSCILEHALVLENLILQIYSKFLVVRKSRFWKDMTMTRTKWRKMKMRTLTKTKMKTLLETLTKKKMKRKTKTNRKRKMFDAPLF
nr:F-box/LRR-repeat protein At3g58900 [Oryza sativa Japonica Group]